MSNTRKTNPDLAALLAAAKLPERTVDLCLRGDLQAEWEALQTQLQDAQRAEPTSLADPAPAADLEEQIRQLEETMSASVLTLRLRALNRKEFQDLALKHPPREDHRLDKMYGLNIETFNAELVQASCVDPQLDEDQWRQLLGVLTPGQYKTLTDTCDVLNHSPVDVPFSSNGSPRAPNSAPS